MNKLAINTVGTELESAADFCRSEGIGIEVTDFAFPKNLDGDISANTERHRKAVAGIAPLILHGPFLDLVANSPDPAIVDVSKRRHKVALQAAKKIGATLYVAHTNFNELIRSSGYRKNYTKRMHDFWLPFADWAAKHGIVICLENLWEKDPEIQAELITSAGHPSLKASFDNGHALVFSDKPSPQWIETLGAEIAHCHLHDNSGEEDEHNIIGEGKENWKELFDALKKWAPQTILVAECDLFEKNRISIERIKSF